MRNSNFQIWNIAYNGVTVAFQGRFCMQLLLLSPNDQMKLCIVNNLSIVSLVVTLDAIDFDTSVISIIRVMFSSSFVLRVCVQTSFVPDAREATARGWLSALSLVISAILLWLFTKFHFINSPYQMLFALRRQLIIITGFRWIFQSNFTEIQVFSNEYFGVKLNSRCQWISIRITLLQSCLNF